jgi:lactoylglutathione lyase
MSAVALGRRFMATATARPFKVLGVQQVALGGTSKAALSKLWVDVLGLTKTTSFKSEKENVDEDVLVCGSVLRGACLFPIPHCHHTETYASSSSSCTRRRGPFAVEIDLMQPIDAEKSPKVHIPPLNHMGIWIDDLSAAVTWLQSQGVRFAPGGIRKGASGFNVAFMHPKGNEQFPLSGEGVLIELVRVRCSLTTTRR